MKKQELKDKTLEVYRTTRDALTILYTALPPGQRRTVAKNPEVKALLERYGVEVVE